MTELKEFSRELVELIDSGEISDRQKLNCWKAKLAKKYSFKDMISNPVVLCSGVKISKKAHSLLCKKPVRSMSGITVVAAMVPPHDCPGECIYCPSSLVDSKTPKSYTGREPATMRALQSNFDAGIQVRARLRQLKEAGHSVSKVELIVMGGTVFSETKKFQDKFMLSALNAFTERNARSIKSAKKNAEKSKTRVTGITFETRPDYCKKKHVNRMLEYGGTRCELGAQILNDRVYKKIKRGHTVQDVVDATRNLKDAGFKVLYHAMPGLPSASSKDDIESFRKMFQREEFKPDMLKIYPCLVIRGTKLHKEMLKGNFSPITEKQAIKLISKVKEMVPPWVRIMRIQRDIPVGAIEAGIKHSNLRQLVEKEMKSHGKKCGCIRCREATLKKYKEKIELNPKQSRLFIDKYRASKGTELFISLEDKKRAVLFGFCRLRVPDSSFRKELRNAAIVRELRVFGEPLALHSHKSSALQHKGVGKSLFSEAEKLAFEVFDKKKLAVIAGLGVREYYRKQFGCRTDGAFVSKTI